jgi:hypothetical protein
MDGQETTKVVFWLGETIGFWIQTGAFFLSAVGAIAVIYYNGKQARVSALINLLVTKKASNRPLLKASYKRINCLISYRFRPPGHCAKNPPSTGRV